MRFTIHCKYNAGAIKSVALIRILHLSEVHLRGLQLCAKHRSTKSGLEDQLHLKIKSNVRMLHLSEVYLCGLDCNWETVVVAAISIGSMVAIAYLQMNSYNRLNRFISSYNGFNRVISSFKEDNETAMREVHELRNEIIDLRRDLKEKNTEYFKLMGKLSASYVMKEFEWKNLMGEIRVEEKLSWDRSKKYSRFFVKNRREFRSRLVEALPQFRPDSNSKDDLLLKGEMVGALATDTFNSLSNLVHDSDSSEAFVAIYAKYLTPDSVQFLKVLCECMPIRYRIVEWKI